ncbi:ABC transporter ATP-binding protein [Thermoplasma sp.]|uniref:ABC transporter ATP-binding protein n=1 Tax=Thermoplasma sp. TaxID=1973142 RepID=UPI0025F8DDEB|nr:ATP-binding cassette domain-containing protein [Thermoplasma sp.]
MIMLSAEHLYKVYLEKISIARWRKRTIITDFSYDFLSETRYGLIGLSGSGKTSLANILAGFDRPDAGRVLYAGHDVKQSQIRVRNVFQDTYRFLNPVNTVIWYEKTVSRISPDPGLVDRILDMVGLPVEKYGDIYIDQLSGGQRQRLAFSIVASQIPEVVILDEPFSMIDPANTLVLFSIIKKYLEKSTVIYIDHNLDRIAYLCDQVIAFDHGAVVEEGNVMSVFGDPKTEYVRRMIDAAGKLSSQLR